MIFKDLFSVIRTIMYVGFMIYIMMIVPTPFNWVISALIISTGYLSYKQ